MKIGAFASFMTPASTPTAMAQLARSLEASGMDSLWIGEHVMLFEEMEFPYPGSPDGKLPVPDGFGIPDQVATIGFLASVTRNLRFGTGISLISQRNPIYTAKEFATLDWLTGGRVDLGVGVGWCKEEVLACGYGWEDRGERTNEALDLMKKLWTEPVVTHRGAHFQVDRARMDPKPVQKPHLPLIIGGYSAPAMRRAATYGAGWLGFGLNSTMARAALAQLEDALAAANRSRESFEVIMMPGGDNEDEVKAFRDMGVDRLVPLIATGEVAEPMGRLMQLETYATIAE